MHHVCAENVCVCTRWRAKPPSSECDSEIGCDARRPLNARDDDDDAHSRLAHISKCVCICFCLCVCTMFCTCSAALAHFTIYSIYSIYIPMCIQFVCVVCMLCAYIFRIQSQCLGVCVWGLVACCALAREMLLATRKGLWGKQKLCTYSNLVCDVWRARSRSRSCVYFYSLKFIAGVRNVDAFVHINFIHTYTVNTATLVHVYIMRKQIFESRRKNCSIRTRLHVTS